MGNKDCNEVIEEKNATLNQFERNKFFYGKLMTVRDFELEQNYFNGKRHLLNRLIHGVGLVCGLKVENPTPKGNTLMINLTSGAALDCWGREIVVDKTYEGLEVKGTFDNTKLNYLYLKQKPCLKDPIPVLANASTCEQECCYSRIKEGFEVVLGSKPKTISGKVSSSDETPIPTSGAKVDALQKELVKATTITDSEGDYTLIVREGSYTIRVTASGYKEKSWEEVDASSENIDFSLETDGSGTKEYKDIPQDYYEEHLKECPECDCDDPKVLLAVVKKTDSGIEVNEPETRKYRSIVYNNPMLNDLLCSHLVDFDNPHRTTAKQVEALKSVEGVENPGGDIDLVQKNAVEITPDNNAKTISIGENHSPRKNNPHQVKPKQIGAMVGIKVGPKSVDNWHTYVELEADEPIKIVPNPEQHKVIISAPSVVKDFYREEETTLNPGQHQTIQHQFGRSPVVDVYKRVTVSHSFIREEIDKVAKDIGIARSQLERLAVSLEAFCRKANIDRTELATFNAFLKRVPKTYNVFVSEGLRKLSERPFREIEGNVRIAEYRVWLKIVGSKASPDLAISSNEQRVVIKNVSEKEAYTLKVILRA